jgi:hypothetical protein
MMEELTAAEEAKKIIDGLSVSSPDNPTVLATLRNRRMTWLEEQRRQPHQAPVL